MKLSVVNETGRELRKVDVDETVFGITPNIAVLHQAFVTQRANQRAGTASTKSRGEVQGSTRKVHRQKTTGQARAGGNRSPIRVGGGRAFGPRPRSYAKDFPKKMRRLAIRSALSGKVADGQLVVIDQLAMDRPKTKEMLRLLGNVGFNRSALVVTGSADRMVLASVRNLDKTKMLPAAYLNVVDMMNHAGLLMTEEAVRVAEKLWGKKEETNGARPGRRLRKPEALVTEEERKAAAPSRRSQAGTEVAPAAEETPTGRRTKFVPKTPKAEAEAVAEPEVTAAAEAIAEPEATAPAKPRRAAKPKATGEPKAKPARAAKPKATGEPKAKPARAPKTKATTDVKAAAPKAAPKSRAKPKPEASTAAPKAAPKPRAKKPAKEGADAAPKPKRTKKTEEGE
jgi:large subunit ribosomal protein L4